MSHIVEPVTPANITAWQISVTNPKDCVEAINTVINLGYKATTTTYIQPNSNPAKTVWQLTLSRPGYADINAKNTDWIIYDGTNVTVLTADEFTKAYRIVS
ncbi:hypothetical protein [Mycobacterium intracellulare]|uniref:hypothetical protein n=1 Tax=Mycobacterium intracellulare TaxID=1767 RepID=UPI00109E4561|nr:hypothetical protein [Mycobacterium intracellulare]